MIALIHPGGPGLVVAIIGLVALVWFGEEADRRFVAHLARLGGLLLVALVAVVGWFMLWP